MRALGLARIAAGAALLWGSAAAAGYAVAWTVRSHETSDRVLAEGKSRLSAEKAYDAGTSCRAATPASGELAGFLEVPRLHLKAPVEQGESEAVLSAAVGHDTSSAWPGQDGTAVLAAHDVSWFSRIGTLRPGDRIVYVSSCRTVTFSVTGHRIVPSGSPVANSAGPTLVLDTCWPNDALWWTPDRELVAAREVSSAETARSALEPGAAAPAAPVAVPAPPALVAEGLTLDTNPTLLGTMQVSGSPDPRLVQSPELLDVEQAALTAYYGTLHALAQGSRPYFADLAPGLTFPARLAGYKVSEYLSRLHVDLVATGEQVSGAVLSAEVALSAPSGAVSDVTLLVASRIGHGELTVTSWRATPVV